MPVDGHSEQSVSFPLKKRRGSAKTEWSLVCITRKGKVSILKDLDLFTARETYKKLRPEQHPKTYIWPECGSHSSGAYMTWGSDSDCLEKVEVIGPTGVDLDPWHGVEPKVVDLRREHEMYVKMGHIKCRKCSALTEEDKERRRRRELFAAVPTAFWLDDSPASVIETRQGGDGTAPSRSDESAVGASRDAQRLVA